MCEIVRSVRIPKIEVKVVTLQVIKRHSPGTIILHSIGPPSLAVRELLKSKGPGFGVFFSSLWSLQLVEPDLLCGHSLFEKQHVGRNVCIRSKNSIRKPHY